MGYTVFFTHNRAFTTEEWGQIRAAVIPMFHRLKQIKGGMGEGRPIVNNDEISFNGDASKGEDHETFQLLKDGAGFQFCKTARKPYDRYVKAVLCLADYFAPGALDISCDGDNEPDCWTQGVYLANQHIPQGSRSVISPLERKRHVAMTESAIAASQQFQESHPEPYQNAYKGAFSEIDEAIKLWETLTKGNKVHSFLANYLKANIDDLKDAYQGT